MTQHQQDKSIRFPFTGLAKGLWFTLKYLFKPVPTVMYPQVQEIPVAPGIHGPEPWWRCCATWI